MDRASNTAFDLSPAETLQLVGYLWDDLAANPSDVPAHDWHLQEPDRRRANLQGIPASGLPWPEVKRLIQGRRGR